MNENKSDRLYQNLVQGLQELGAHFRGEITLRTTTLSNDAPDAPEPVHETAWYSVNGDGVALTAQLLREIAPDNPLAVAELTPVLRRFDRDDVVFQVTGAKSPVMREFI